METCGQAPKLDDVWYYCCSRPLSVYTAFYATKLLALSMPTCLESELDVCLSASV